MTPSATLTASQWTALFHAVITAADQVEKGVLARAPADSPARAKGLAVVAQWREALAAIEPLRAAPHGVVIDAIPGLRN